MQEDNLTDFEKYYQDIRDIKLKDFSTEELAKLNKDIRNNKFSTEELAKLQDVYFRMLEEDNNKNPKKEGKITEVVYFLFEALVVIFEVAIKLFAWLIFIAMIGLILTGGK
jgi:hypothetical protein